MKPQTIFFIIIAILIFNYVLEIWLDWLNDKNSSDTLPIELADIYDEEKYQKSRAYDKSTGKFSKISSAFSLLLMLGMLFFEGFAVVDEFSKSVTTHSIFLLLFCFS